MPARISKDNERLLRSALVLITAGGLGVGLAVWGAGGADVAAWVWAAATTPVVIALGVEIVAYAGVRSG